MTTVSPTRRKATALLAFLLITTTLAFAPPPIPARAATSDLIISEYIEGTSFNKAVEIYNGTGATVDLSTYTLELYSNGSATVTQSVALTGSVADGEVFVVSRSDADPAIVAVTDQLAPAVINFNGDDALVLRNDGVVVDSFGQVGVDPGVEWTGGGQDDTLTRKVNVCAGDTNPTDAFDASLEWDTFPVNTFTELGAHTADCESSGLNELLISEYIEGTSLNKAVEIYNGTGATVDLSTYTLELYSNGAVAPSQSVALTGSVADGDVFVVSRSDADPAIVAVADQLAPAVINFNGDDALVLRNDGVVVDSFGQVGVDPGSEWAGGGQDDTLTRKVTVCAGDTNPTDAFDASLEWDTFPVNTFTELGAHTADCGAGTANEPVVAVCDVQLNLDEGAGGSVSLSASDADGTVVDISVSVDPSPAPGSITVDNLIAATSNGGTATADLVVDSAVPAGAYEVTVTASNNDATPQTGTCTQDVYVFGALTAIHDIQGIGDASLIVGSDVVIEGVVVGDYEGPSPALRGFYLQEEDGDQDGDPATSEGIFVFHGDVDSVNLGDVVTVAGTVAEFQDQTQLNFPDAVEVRSSGNAVTTATASLPVSSADGLERFEGMLVTFPQTLYVTEFFQLGRFGQVVVSSGDRLPQPTSIAEPGAPANAVQAANDLNRLIIDDADNGQNPDPIVFGRGGNELTATNTLRGGDTLTDAVGVMTYTWAGNAASGNAYRLRPVGDLSDTGLVPGGEVPNFVAANPRPATAPLVGGSGKVASFNVLNYFVSIDDGVDECGPTGFPQDCRGADTEFELDRQRDKLIPALLNIDADVLGLIELENTEGVEPLADIVTELNARTAPGTYAYIETGTIGTDVIKVGIIYQPDRATPSGDFAILDSGVDPRFDDDLNRPALAQSFVSDGETFTVVVNHLKSKGCGGDTGLDTDQGDGAGCFNLARAEAAEAEVDWIASDPTGVVDGDFLVLGDLNSYAKEDPIDVFVDAGFIDLGRLYGGDENYSYVFDGQWGYLDYALASPSMAEKVTGTAEYHINADEPSVLDYNTDFQSSNQVELLYNDDEFRTSDHDPVVVGYCEAVAPTASASASPNSIWPPNGKLKSISVTLDVTDPNLASVELVSVGADEPINAGDIVVIDDTHFRVRAERDDEGDGRVYTMTYLATDTCGNTTEFTATVVVPHDQGNKANTPI